MYRLSISGVDDYVKAMVFILLLSFFSTSNAIALPSSSIAPESIPINDCENLEMKNTAERHDHTIPIGILSLNSIMKQKDLWLSTLLLLLHPDQNPDTSLPYGADANPTGNPIGGGIGYNDIIQPNDPRVIAIIHDKAGLLAALNQAKPGDIVYVDGNAHIDLSGTFDIRIPGGVTIASNRGENGAPGGRIYQNAFAGDPQSGRPFNTDGPDIRITGLRLQGPYPTSENFRDGRHAIRSNHDNFEVDNCEIYEWGYAAIRLQDTGPDSGQYIHHNHIHTNLFTGTGYGIILFNSEVLIEANLFDNNRHSITGAGRPYCSFEARYNIVGPNAESAYFDMHQDPDALQWGGDWIWIHHNTFLGTDQNAYNQRGQPRTGAWIEYNIMDSRYAETGPVRQTFHDLAPEQSPYGKVYMSNNIIQGVLSKKGPVYYVHDARRYVEPTPYPANPRATETQLHLLCKENFE
ncbi:hypothetical protein J2T58_001968 [Methanocalculus alkaliphilus]|nr:hypothetical protein [Methanocalculus alkaliphilus]